VVAGETVRSSLVRRTGGQAAEDELAAAAAGLVEGTGAADRRYELALERFNSLGAATSTPASTRSSTAWGWGPGWPSLRCRPVGGPGGQGGPGGDRALPLRHHPAGRAHQRPRLRGPHRLEGRVRARRGGMVIVSHDRTSSSARCRRCWSSTPIPGPAGSTGGWSGYQASGPTPDAMRPRGTRSTNSNASGWRTGPSDNGSGPSRVKSESRNQSDNDKASGTSGSTARRSWRPRPARPIGPWTASRWWPSPSRVGPPVHHRGGGSGRHRGGAPGRGGHPEGNIPAGPLDLEIDWASGWP